MSTDDVSFGRPPRTASPQEVAEFVRQYGRPYDPDADDKVQELAHIKLESIEDNGSAQLKMF